MRETPQMGIFQQSLLFFLVFFEYPVMLSQLPHSPLEPVRKARLSTVGGPPARLFLEAHGNALFGGRHPFYVVIVGDDGLGFCRALLLAGVATRAEILQDNGVDVLLEFDGVVAAGVEAARALFLARPGKAGVASDDGVTDVDFVAGDLRDGPRRALLDASHAEDAFLVLEDRGAETGDPPGNAGGLDGVYRADIDAAIASGAIFEKGFFLESPGRAGKGFCPAHLKQAEQDGRNGAADEKMDRVPS
jgi:hypothetical protein